jgi:type IV secretory pathway VirB3-like protein
VDWKDFFKQRFRRGFIDGSEVLLFVFFLTMDSTKLLFLPARLNIPIKAALAGNDLMVKGFVFQNNFKFTLTLIVVSISIEILRNVLRVVVSAEENYRLLFLENMQKAEKSRLITLVKLAVRRSFNDAKDDLMRFITFTTILFIAFLFFPRLKLLTLVVASVGNLTLDMFIRSRLMNQKSDDLISRCLDKLFFRDKAKSVNTQLMQTAPTQDPEVN